MKRYTELEGETYVKESQNFKVNERGKDSCVLTTSGVAFAKQITHNRKLLCDYYKKATLFFQNISYRFKRPQPFYKEKAAQLKKAYAHHIKMDLLSCQCCTVVLSSKILI